MKITIQDARTLVTLQQRDFRVTISGARGPAGPAGPSEWGGIDGDIEDQTDLYNALQTKVPYTGATQDVNLGEYGAQLGNLEFDNTPTNVPTAAGSVYWNDTDGTLNLVLKGGQVISRIGETQHIRALNNTGAQIARGKVVYVVGAQGQRLTIALADADTEILSKDTIGFTAEAIADGAEGFVIVQGVINNISTTGMTDGATVYLSQTAGGYTTTAPTDPAHLVVLGFIVNGGSGGAGSIYVKVDNGYELEELHGVADAAKVTPVGADALLLRDSADSNLWKRLTWTNALAGVKSHMDTFKSVANGYASLDGSGKVPASELPSYVDDVVEVASFAALPGTGETGKIYVTLDTNKCYRWSGSVYVQVAQGIDTLTTTGTSGAATLVGSTLNIPQYQGVLTNPVTGTGTAGQVAYFNGTSAVTGSANLFWDNANGRLGIGTNAPATTLQVNGASTFNQRINLIGAAQSNPIGGASVAIDYQNTSDLQGRIRSMDWDAGIWKNMTYSAFSHIFETQSNLRLTISDAGFVRINNTDGTGRLTVRGSGTTSATTALLVQNSTPSELLKITDNGVATLTPTTLTGSEATSALDISQTWNTTGTPTLIKANVTNTASNADSRLVDLQVNGSPVFRILQTGIVSASSVVGQFSGTLTLRSNLATIAGNYLLLDNNNLNITTTTSQVQHTRILSTYSPTSGTGVFNQVAINSTINQTGGANGITRGLYVNPTLTSAADWRSIETSNNTGYSAYFAGSADLFLGNGTDIQIGTTTGTKIGTATTQKIGLWNATPIVQPTTAVAAATRVGGGGTTVTDTDTFDGYTIAQLVKALRNMGALA